MDDLSAILDDERATRVRDYGRTVLNRLAATGRNIAARISAIRNEHHTRKAQALAWCAATNAEPQLRPWGFVWLDETNRGTDDPAETMMRKMREHATRLCSSGPNVEQRVLPLLGDDPPRWNPPDGGEE